MGDQPYNIIRNLRGSWPEWFADLDNMDTVYIRIRYGKVWIGQGVSQDDAMNKSRLIKEIVDYCGVTDVVDALVELRRAGYYYVCPQEVK